MEKSEFIIEVRFRLQQNRFISISLSDILLSPLYLQRCEKTSSLCFGENKGSMLHTFAGKTKVSSYKVGVKSKIVTIAASIYY